jgi:cyanophycin synthetase
MELNIFRLDNAGRIPIVAVTGDRMHDAARCLAALLTDAGYRVGRASRDAVFLAGRKINAKDAAACDCVDAVILECDDLDLLGEGFRCDVALLTGAEEASAAWLAVLHTLAPDGKAVLNADDPPSFDSALPSADRLIWFAQSGDNEQLFNHRADGGVAVFLCGDSLVVAQGDEEHRLPFGGRPVERELREQLALLAALAGAMALNLCGDDTPSTPLQESETLEAVLSTV